jgi:hypothetical protein
MSYIHAEASPLPRFLSVRKLYCIARVLHCIVADKRVHDDSEPWPATVQYRIGNRRNAHARICTVPVNRTIPIDKNEEYDFGTGRGQDGKQEAAKSIASSAGGWPVTTTMMMCDTATAVHFSLLRLGWACCSSSIQHPLGGGLVETNDDDDVEGRLNRILLLLVVLLIIVALAS